MLIGVVNGWMMCDTSILFARFSQRRIVETIKEVGNHMVYGRDHGKTATLCPRQVSQFRRLLGWS